MSVGLLYVGLFAAGAVYALVSGAFGWLADLGGHGDVGVDASGHLEAATPHPISGTTIATFITGFGGGGVVAHFLFGWGLVGGLAFATGVGFVLATAAFLGLQWVFSQTQAGSEFGVQEIVGREAEVTTPIPAGGVGEISYIVKGQRETGPARSTQGEAVARGRTVVVERVLGSTHYVRPR